MKQNQYKKITLYVEKLLNSAHLPFQSPYTYIKVRKKQKTGNINRFSLSNLNAKFSHFPNNNDCLRFKIKRHETGVFTLKIMFV